VYTHAHTHTHTHRTQACRKQGVLPEELVHKPPSFYGQDKTVTPRVVELRYQTANNARKERLRVCMDTYKDMCAPQPEKKVGSLPYIYIYIFSYVVGFYSFIYDRVFFRLNWTLFRCNNKFCVCMCIGFFFMRNRALFNCDKALLQM